MDAIILKSQGEDGEILQATFLPEKGMNLISYKKGEIEVIAQSTKPLFEERFAGLGALIGPHFHRRHPAVIPLIKNETLFPHIARVKEKGIKDPFSHGIARYAPWQAKSSQDKVTAKLTGKDQWNNVSLAELEGQNFTIEMEASLSPKGLNIILSVVSEVDSLIGFHYYYNLPNKTGIVKAKVQKQMREDGEVQKVPSTWNLSEEQDLHFDLREPADYTFYPFPNACEGQIELVTSEYKLITTYLSASQENCWQLYHPEGSSFVCIEPISSQDPLHPNLTASTLQINLEIKDS